MRACAACGQPAPLRWRNPTEPAPVLVHVAGPIIDCREYRRSCPDFIVDRRQTCLDCGRELARGRWALFYRPGSMVAELCYRSGAPARVFARPRGDDGEQSCVA